MFHPPHLPRVALPYEPCAWPKYRKIGTGIGISTPVLIPILFLWGIMCSNAAEQHMAKIRNHVPKRLNTVTQVKKKKTTCIRQRQSPNLFVYCQHLHGSQGTKHTPGKLFTESTRGCLHPQTTLPSVSQFCRLYAKFSSENERKTWGFYLEAKLIEHQLEAGPIQKRLRAGVWTIRLGQ